ncbi:MCP four helix bundle domain-containing protein [Massilia endophytica]|uniref:MCP four helix bundle domain-containing protein n=1 Tax=Massilia endophytica TaxID=2899220 RepID=UPI001E5D2AD8|nr:MCP four helix bundle domain-containing protein [Massilia endophytica]UGQ45504.1 methyl-accepting chemotaxis protein [Massilia endophytica]
MKFSDWKVGTRLAAGFAVMVALLMGLGSLSVLAMNETRDETVVVLEQALQTERMLKEWHGVIEVNLVRSVAAAKASDPAVQKQFEEAIAQASARATALQKTIGERLPDGEAKKLFEEVHQRRAAYREARAAAFKQKQAGNVEQANRFFDTELASQASGYMASLDKLVRYQQQLINRSGEDIKVLSGHTAQAVTYASLLAIVVAAGMGYAIARSLLRQLGGEPAYAAEVTARIAAGDLSQPVTLRAGDRSSLLFSIAQMRDSLAGIVGEVRSGTDRVLHASREIAGGVSDLSGRTEKYPRTQCRGGSGKGGRAGTRLCRGGQRGTQSGRPFRQRGQGDQVAH